MTSADVPPGVPPIGLLHMVRVLCIYRRHETNTLMWITLGVHPHSPALIAAASATLLIVHAQSLTRYIQYMELLCELLVFSHLLAHSGMAFAAIGAALLAVKLVTGAGRGAWFDAGDQLASV